MSTVKEAMHYAHRNGSSLKAKFFRWKDKVLKRNTIVSAFAEELSTSELLKVFGGSSDLRKTMEKLMDNPDDPVVYEKAVASVRDLASRIKEAGGDVDPDVPLEE